MKLALPRLWPVLVLCSCKPDGTPTLERMIDQTRLNTWETSPVFGDGFGMRNPPEGTVPRDAVMGPAPFVSGLSGGQALDRPPIPVDRALLERGRNRFDIFCAACHGRAGDGDTPVARNMTLRAPPSLLEPRLRTLPVGRIFQVATEGYGFMSGYAVQLPVRDRWAVAAYVKALQFSAGVPLSDLPPALQQKARGELR